MKHTHTDTDTDPKTAGEGFAFSRAGPEPAIRIAHVRNQVRRCPKMSPRKGHGALAADGKICPKRKCLSTQTELAAKFFFVFPSIFLLRDHLCRFYQIPFDDGFQTQIFPFKTSLKRHCCPTPVSESGFKAARSRGGSRRPSTHCTPARDSHRVQENTNLRSRQHSPTPGCLKILLQLRLRPISHNGTSTPRLGAPLWPSKVLPLEAPPLPQKKKNLLRRILKLWFHRIWLLHSRVAFVRKMLSDNF